MKSVAYFFLKVANLMLSFIGFRIEIQRIQKHNTFQIAKILYHSVRARLKIESIKTRLRSFIFRQGIEKLTKKNSGPDAPIDKTDTVLDLTVKAAASLSRDKAYLMVVSKTGSEAVSSIVTKQLTEIAGVSELNLGSLSTSLKKEVEQHLISYQLNSVKRNKQGPRSFLRAILILLPIEVTKAFGERGQEVKLQDNEYILLGNGSFIGKHKDGSIVTDRTVGFHAPKELLLKIGWVSYSLYNGDMKSRIELGSDNNYTVIDAINSSSLIEHDVPPIHIENYISSSANIDLRHSTLPNGYKSAVIFSLHGCFNNKELLKALLFGEYGFKKNDLCCTVSTFLENSQNVHNSESYETDATIGYSLSGSSSSSSLGKAIADDPSFELCLHCVDWTEPNDETWDRALKKFTSTFGGSKTYIDHIWYRGDGVVSGPVNSCYNGNANLSGRLADLYKAGTRYFWNTTREYTYQNPSSFTQNNFTIPNALQIATHPDLQSDVISWYTDEYLETSEQKMELLGAQFANWHEKGLDRFIHCYFANANPLNGVWSLLDGEMVLKPHFSQLLTNLGLWQRLGEVWVPTVADYIHYQKLLTGISYSLTNKSRLIVTNDNEEAVSGFTIVVSKKVSIVGARMEKRRTNDFYWVLPSIAGKSTIELEVQNV